MYVAPHLLKCLFWTRTYSGLSCFLVFWCCYTMPSIFLPLSLMEYFLISSGLFYLSRLLKSWLYRWTPPTRYKVCAERPFTEDTLHQSWWRFQEFLASRQRMVRWLRIKSQLLRKETKLHFCFFFWDQSLLKLLRWYFRFLFQPGSSQYVSTDSDLSIVAALHCFLLLLQ